MIYLTRETEELARRLAKVQQQSVDDVIRQALEARAETIGLVPGRPRRRQTADQILAAGGEVAARPLLDTRTPRQIIEDISVPG
jgi:antitoxin VapB